MLPAASRDSVRIHVDHHGEGGSTVGDSAVIESLSLTYGHLKQSFLACHVGRGSDDGSAR